MCLLLITLVSSCNTKPKNTLKPPKTSRVAVLPYFKEASFTPVWLTQKPHNFHKIPSFTLVNQNGQNVTEKTFAQKIYVADFFFTSCPGICPRMTNNMHKIQEAFKNDDEVLLLSHSVTPVIDSVPTLKHYAQVNNVLDHKWHLVTGNRQEIYDLGRKFYFVEEDLGIAKAEDDFLHTENFILVDKNKHIRGIYNGLNTASVNQLIADIETLKKEG